MQISKHLSIPSIRLHQYCGTVLTSFSRQTVDEEVQGANLTNLALKGIIAVKAMAEISRAVNRNTDAQVYDVRCAIPIFRLGI